MNLDRMRAVRNFQALGMKDADKVLGEYAQQGPFGALESGAIDVAEFHRQMSALIPGGASDEDIDRAFISFLDGIPEKRLEALLALRKQFKVYLLSNTNELMWNTEIKRQFSRNGRHIDDYFDGIVTSFVAKVMKPAPGIFNYTEKMLGIRPEETLFLDDSSANCEAAAALGWHTAVVEPGVEFSDIIRDYLNTVS